MQSANQDVLRFFSPCVVSACLLKNREKSLCWWIIQTEPLYMLESWVNAVRSLTPEWVYYRPHVSKLCMRHLPINEKLIFTFTSHPKHFNAQTQTRKEWTLFVTVQRKDKCKFLRKKRAYSSNVTHVAVTGLVVKQLETARIQIAYENNSQRVCQN